MSDVTRRRPPPAIVAAKPIELQASGDFAAWLESAGGGLAVTTYNSGKLALLTAAAGKLGASFWHFPRPMGVAWADGRVALASRDHIWLFRADPDGRPAFALESVATTGRVDAHDLAFDHRGVAFANTRFNCVSRPREGVRFVHTWRPSFADPAARTDCCHLNGIGVRSGRLAAATAFCESGAPAAWRAEDRFTSGVLIDVPSSRVIARGLCMPHSPRWHDGRWWLCDSGQGALCEIDAASDELRTVIELPGFTRGLAFAADRAIVGLSRIRKRHILDAPPVRGRFPKMRSGLWLVDPATRASTGSLEFVRGGREVYDVAFVPGLRNAELASFVGGQV